MRTEHTAYHEVAYEKVPPPCNSPVSKWANTFTSLSHSLAARLFNLPDHCSQHDMKVCALSLHWGSTESRKRLEQKFIFQIGTFNPHGIKERCSWNKFILIFLRSYVSTYSVSLLFFISTRITNNFLIHSGDGLAFETSAFEFLYGDQFT